jgi:NAD(P)-dependent dehydrogenase (short-subunit alcohol dehydrogenase family)
MSMPARGQALAAELGADARSMRCDVASRAEVEAATAATLAAFGRIDVLINNAGIFRAADFLDIARPTGTR